MKSPKGTYFILSQSQTYHLTASLLTAGKPGFSGLRVLGLAGEKLSGRHGPLPDEGEASKGSRNTVSQRQTLHTHTPKPLTPESLPTAAPSPEHRRPTPHTIARMQAPAAMAAPLSSSSPREKDWPVLCPTARGKARGTYWLAYSMFGRSRNTRTAQSDRDYCKRAFLFPPLTFTSGPIFLLAMIYSKIP